MNDKELYFENVAGLGDLFIEHVFYEYDEPILFVCTDDRYRRYLCSCCDLSKQWVLTSTSEEDLIQMIDNKISLENMFVISETHVISWDNGILSIRAYDPGTDDLLPRHGAMLELPVTRTADYRATLDQPFRFFWRDLCDWKRVQAWRDVASEPAAGDFAFLADGMKESYNLNEIDSFALPNNSTFSARYNDFSRIRVGLTFQDRCLLQSNKDARQNVQITDNPAA